MHGISNEFLADKPDFAAVVDDFLEYIKGAELIIHNAPFDVGFINAELNRVGPEYGSVDTYCTVTDTLVMARKKRPGKKNNLDVLCKEYDVNNSQRDLHGALLDAELLAEVYLHMTGGQSALLLDSEEVQQAGQSVSTNAAVRRISKDRPALKIVHPNVDEAAAHQAFIKKMGENCLWKKP